MTPRHDDRLRAAIGGHHTVPPILAAVWEALQLRLDLAPPGAWTDSTDLADNTAAFLDCSPGLVDELLHVAVTDGLLDLDPDGRAVRLPNPTDRRTARHHERNPR